MLSKKQKQQKKKGQQQESRILDAWRRFADDGKDPERALRALGVDPDSELLELLEGDEGVTEWERFLEVAKVVLVEEEKEGKARDRDGEAEVESTFRLFTKNRGDGSITIEDLRRVARELKEDVGEQALRDMIAVASSDGVVDIRAFEGVMRRAGVL